MPESETLSRDEVADLLFRGGSSNVNLARYVLNFPEAELQTLIAEREKRMMRGLNHDSVSLPGSFELPVMTEGDIIHPGFLD